MVSGVYLSFTEVHAPESLFELRDLALLLRLRNHAVAIIRVADKAVKSLKKERGGDRVGGEREQ